MIDEEIKDEEIIDFKKTREFGTRVLRTDEVNLWLKILTKKNQPRIKRIKQISTDSKLITHDQQLISELCVNLCC